MQTATTTLPRGWFRVALSQEVGKHKTRAVRLLGRELVLFRDRHGTAHAVGAYCPHLGAHLGDAEVADGRVRCPFHGWCFDGSGRCVEVPFARKIPPRAELGSVITRERDGVIFVWNGASTPDFAVPRVPELAAGGWSTPIVWRRAIRGRFNDLKENIVDAAHFPATHAPVWRRFVAPPKIVEHTVEPTHFSVTMEAMLSLFGLRVGSRFRFDLHGPGIEIVHVATPSPMIFRFLSTPIDDGNIDFLALLQAPQQLVPGTTWLWRQLIRASVARDVNMDAHIWEHKRYLEKPILSDADGPIVMMRRWLSQFNEPALIAPAYRVGSPGSSSTPAA
jgi:phenylpropionate dioxygenase-like ring-hydroxylating dioxygenase large terminal subunit